MRIGIIDLLVDTPNRTWLERLYATYFRRQFTGIMPQAVAVWCRQLGHDVTYATYFGQSDPRRLLPDGLDIVFISAYTQASALAYALATLYRQDGTLTVLGGPHAKSFPTDCLRYFDVVVEDCDRTLIDDILRGHIEPPCIVTSGRAVADIPTVEERFPDIVTAAFVRGRPTVTSIAPVLASVGCPYQCDFCVDWNNDYVAFPRERLAADLGYLSENFPGILVGFHDPNFGVRFDETMEVMESIPKRRRNRYIMESSLSILKESRLSRLTETNCVYVAPGVESWADYSNKAGAGAALGRRKLDQVIGHFDLLGRFVGGMQANFLFGSEVDKGSEPVELTKEFIRRLPLVWPTINIPTPFGGSPLYDSYVTGNRILSGMPFAFYYSPYLAITIRQYDPAGYYGHLIDMHASAVSASMLRRRLLTRSPPAIRFVHSLRTFGERKDLAEYRRIRDLMATDPSFRAFHEGRSVALPEFYHRRFEERLGPYAELLPRAERAPIQEVPASAKEQNFAPPEPEFPVIAQTPFRAPRPSEPINI